jgi:hypothetical protein
MLLWAGRLFASSTEAYQHLVFLVVCAAGIVDATYLWIIDGSMLLLLLAWPLYRPFFERAALLEGKGGAAGATMRLAIVAGMKLGRDALSLAGAFLIGSLMRWTWLAEVGQAALLNIFE